MLDPELRMCHTFRMTDSRERRVNARIDSELERKLGYLRGRTQQNTTAVVREAIERYHAAISKSGGTPSEILQRSGFLGGFDGPSELSVRYKEELVASLAKKT